MWLPEDVVIRLNIFEAGWLTGKLARLRSMPSHEDIPVNKPDAHGQPIPTTMISSLSEKIDAAVEERQKR